MNRKQRKQRIRAEQMRAEAEVRSAGVSPAVSPASCRPFDGHPPGSDVGSFNHSGRIEESVSPTCPRPGCGGEDAATTAGGTPALQFDRDTQRCARAMNRMRQHRELCKREKIKMRPAGLRNVYGKIAPSQMVWRRVSGMTIPIEPFMDAAERKVGLGRLMAWLEKKVRGTKCEVRSDYGQLQTAEYSEDGTDQKAVGGMQKADVCATGSLPLAARANSPGSLDCPGTSGNQERENSGNSNGDKSVPATGRQDAGDTAGGTPALRSDRLVLSDWNSELGSWQRVKTDGFSIEAVCAQLGITRWKLTQLTREYCNLTATELFDGWKVRQLKSFMLERLRDAAQQLWKYPGDYAQYKAQGFLDCQSAPLRRGESMHGQRDAGDTAGRMPAVQTAALQNIPALRMRERRKESKYFLTKPKDLFTEEKWEEKERRTAALIEKMWDEFDFESWALAAGYSSVRRLKRAVLNVLGKTFERLERCLAGEIIEYYQCAEERELRNIALREDDCDAILDARRLYHKSDEKPAEPFLDMWSAYEFAAKDWLVRMAGAFG